MTLTSRLTEAIRACFTGLWIESHEPEDALTEIAQLCRQQNWTLAVWDIVQGLQIPGAAEHEDQATDPLAAIQALNALATPTGSTLLVLRNAHRFLQSAEIVQALQRQLHQGKQNRTFILVLAPETKIPLELEKLFLVLEHELPGRDQLAQIAQGIATQEGELPAGEELESLLDAAAGLTRQEAEGAFSLSLVRYGQITTVSVWELKAGMLKKSGLLKLHRGNESFQDLGGLESLKTFCRRTLQGAGRRDIRRRPRGILLLSPAGCGKSQFAKALGNECGRPTLVLDIGSLLGALVGQTEQNIRQALRLADAMAPCILFVDELDKSLSGAASGGQTDSGVSARLFGSLLTWLSDHTSDVYFIGTCNSIQRLPAEFSRAERFDGIFFLDLPDVQAREAIWRMYLSQYELDPQQRRPEDEQWTGAEIKACCRLAALLDVTLLESAQNIVPVAITAAEAVQELRQWASGRCLSADAPGIYRGSTPAPPSRRRVSRDPSSN